MYKEIKKFIFNRNVGKLDTQFYATWYSDLEDLTDEQLKAHWSQVGKKEGRYPNFESVIRRRNLNIAKLPKNFDWAFYCKSYGDLRDAGVNNRFRAIHHYLLYGKKEGRIYAARSEIHKKYLEQFSKIDNQVIDTVLADIAAHPGSPDFDEILSTVLQHFWSEKEKNFTTLAKSHAHDGVGNRIILLQETEKAVKFIANAYRKEFLFFSEPLNKKIDVDRVLIIGEFGIPQCTRYRIEQKLEQLTAAGFVAKAVSRTDIQRMTFELAFHDVVIFYRVPAYNEIIRLIIQARVLGKLTFYEIDDLLFEPVYPPPIESYGGYVTPEVYVRLIKGMALYHCAAKLCEYGIASTQPLAERLSKLVESGKCFVHRNGLDAHNQFPEQIPRSKPFIDIFYGSGTQAHNSDFIELVLPPLEHMLEKYQNVRLVVVGYLELPSQFLEKFPDRVKTIPIVKSIQSYWSLLSNADINIAVLHRDEINNCKSELKWFEAACFGIPSIVSKTENYEAVIQDNLDGIMVETYEDWINAFEQLIHDPLIRSQMGSRAKIRALADYNIEKLAVNIKNIIMHAAEDKPVVAVKPKSTTGSIHA